eukprot:951488-Rhodomonas_salina.1
MKDTSSQVRGSNCTELALFAFDFADWGLLDGITIPHRHPYFAVAPFAMSVTAHRMAAPSNVHF